MKPITMFKKQCLSKKFPKFEIEYLEKVRPYVYPPDVKMYDYSYVAEIRKPQMENRVQGCLMRGNMVRDFSFSIPDHDVLDEIAKHGPLIELGAGSGYWSYLLKKKGVDVVAYDKCIDLELNEYGFTKHHTKVEVGSIEQLAKHRKRNLMIAWPDNSTFAEEALELFRGDVFFYIGEPNPDTCGTERFFKLMFTQFEHWESKELHRFEGLHDVMIVCKRKK